MNVDKTKELDNIFKYHTSSNEDGFTYGWEKLYKKYKEYRFLALKPFFTGKSVLEVGPAEGDMTAKLMEYFSDVTVIEGSEKFTKNLQKTFKTKKLTIYHGLVEEVCINKKFDTVILSHVLEHFDNPQEILKKMRSLLHKDGNLLVMVPNANSIHRHVGVLLGMQEATHSLNEVDINIGHKRVYDPSSLKAEVEKAGFITINLGGILIKIVSNQQMVKIFTEEVMDALFKIGSEFPEISCEIFIACKKS